MDVYKAKEMVKRTYLSSEELRKEGFDFSYFRYNDCGLHIKDLKSKEEQGSYCFSIHKIEHVDPIVKELLDKLGIKPVPELYDKDCVVDVCPISIQKWRDSFTIEISTGTIGTPWNLESCHWLADPYTGLKLVYITSN